jgi:hypothetical protein
MNKILIILLPPAIISLLISIVAVLGDKFSLFNKIGIIIGLLLNGFALLINFYIPSETSAVVGYLIIIGLPFLVTTLIWGLIYKRKGYVKILAIGAYISLNIVASLKLFGWIY